MNPSASPLRLSLPWGYDGASFLVSVQGVRPEDGETVVLDAVLLSYGTVPEEDRPSLGEIGERVALLVEFNPATISE